MRDNMLEEKKIKKSLHKYRKKCRIKICKKREYKKVPSNSYKILAKVFYKSNLVSTPILKKPL